MTEESIGKAAGSVWKFLKEMGSQGVSVTELKKIKGVKADDAVAALGWLAREGKLSFSGSASRVQVSLVETERETVGQS